MEDRLYTYPYRSGEFGLPRWVRIKMGIPLLVAAIIGVTVPLVLPGGPTPSVAGLRQIPPSALTQLKTRLGTYRRRYISTYPAGTSTRSITGAALLGRLRNRLRLEVSTQYYFRLKDKPPQDAPASWDGTAENYSVAFVRISPGHWRVASILLLPQPEAHEG